MTEETLRRIVEGKWPRANYAWDGDTAVELSGEDRQTSIDVASSSRADTCQMLAAAVLAPELWALVRTARELDEAEQSAPDDFAWQPELHHEVAKRIRAAWMNLRAALAALPEEVGK